MDNYVTIQVAAEKLGVTDQVAFLKMAKKHNCVLKTGGMTRIDLSSLEDKVAKELVEAKNRLHTKKVKLNGAGAKLGVIMGRLNQYETRRQKKNTIIRELEKKVSVALDSYTRSRLNNALEKKRTELKHLDDGYERDVKLRDEILNGNDSEIDKP